MLVKYMVRHLAPAIEMIIPFSLVPATYAHKLNAHWNFMVRIEHSDPVLRINRATQDIMVITTRPVVPIRLVTVPLNDGHRRLVDSVAFSVEMTARHWLPIDIAVALVNTTHG